MDTTADAVRVLARALDQTGDALALVRPEQLDAPTPCSDWDVQRLVDHLVATPRRFLQMLRGEQPDWSAEPPRVTEGWASAFRIAADDLLHAWHQVGDAPAPSSPDWQTAELATHTWDLVQALGRSTHTLDAEVAERALAFMRDNLTDDNRGRAFAQELPAPEGASAYDRLAAFAGRTP